MREEVIHGVTVLFFRMSKQTRKIATRELFFSGACVFGAVEAAHFVLDESRIEIALQCRKKRASFVGTPGRARVPGVQHISAETVSPSVIPRGQHQLRSGLAI